jgi:hypothetical protein
MTMDKKIIRKKNKTFRGGVKLERKIIYILKRMIPISF